MKFFRWQKGSEKFILIIIFLLIFFLHFWKVGELFYFGIDEEYQSLLALSIIKDFHVIWIGLSAANTGFYIGPGLVYVHSLLLWLSKLDPIILAYSASTISFLTLIVLFLVVKHLFDKKTAIITSVIYSFSSFILSYDRRFWNSTFVPITTILFFLSLVKSQKNPRWYILTAALLGFSFHINASLFIFIPILLVIMYNRLINCTHKKNLKISFFTIVSSLIVFIMIYSPLIVFDFVHNFDNLKTPIRMLQNIGKEIGGLSFYSNLQTMQSTLTNFWYMDSLPQIISLVIFLCSLTLIILFILRKKTFQEKILAIIIGFYLFVFMFYPGKILDYYYLGFFPFFAIVVSLFLKRFNYIILLLLGFIFVVNSFVNLFNWPINSGLATKKELIKKTVSVIGNDSFYLETNQDYLYFGGWRYLFEAYGKRPASSQADTMFGWIYPKEISSEKPELKVIISTNKIQPKEKILKTIVEGSYLSYIVKNSL